MVGGKAEELEQARVDFGAGRRGRLNAPFAHELGEGRRADEGGHGGEGDGHGQAGVVRDEILREVVGHDVVAEKGEGCVVWEGRRVGRGVAEGEGEGRERKL